MLEYYITVGIKSISQQCFRTEKWDLQMLFVNT